MEFIAVPTEQTTAVTDLILAAVAAASAWYLWRMPAEKKWKANLWGWLFCLLATAALLGGVAHGFKMSAALQGLLWFPLNLALGLVVALLAVATIADRWGEAQARRLLPILLGLGVAFFGTTLVWPGSFRLFILYQTVVMLFALVCYFGIAWRGGLAGAWLLVAGILISIMAATVQAGQALSLHWIWAFDHNGVYHLLQAVGVVFLVSGLGKALRAQP